MFHKAQLFEVKGISTVSQSLLPVFGRFCIDDPCSRVPDSVEKRNLREAKIAKEKSQLLSFGFNWVDIFEEAIAKALNVHPMWPGESKCFTYEEGVVVDTSKPIRIIRAKNPKPGEPKRKITIGKKTYTIGIGDKLEVESHWFLKIKACKGQKPECITIVDDGAVGHGNVHDATFPGGRWVVPSGEPGKGWLHPPLPEPKSK